MKKTILALLCIAGITFHALSQDTMVVNLLKAPVSPVAQLLNFSPSIIEKPSDIPALWISIQNATNNFSKLPNSYAVDLSPAEIFKSKNQTLESLRQNTGVFQAIGQTFVLSLGFQQFTDSTTKITYPKTGIGFKTSLIRPAWADTTQKMYDQLTASEDSLVDLLSHTDSLVEHDDTVVKLRNQLKTMFDAHQDTTQAYKTLHDLYMSTKAQKYSVYHAQLEDDLTARIKTFASKFIIVRHGFSLDLAGGFTAAFPTNRIDNSVADKAGVWLTGGWVGIKKTMSVLGIVRYLYQPDSIFADFTGKVPTAKVSTLDAGLGFNYTSKDTKLNVGLEGVYRGVLNKNTTVTPSWHVVLNASYNLGNNKLLSLNFGRDFNGVLESGGNLIAGINLILGFGGGKTIPTSSKAAK
jgi:hypothetical protein